jgi:nucleotide-binding universal stress UspA family protein
MCAPDGLSAALAGLKMSSVQHEEDDMYHHALSAPETDGMAHAQPARRNAKSPGRKLLVAYDGSPAARCALDYAIERARESGAAIHVLNVQNALIDDAVFYRSHAQAGADTLKAATAQLELVRVPYTTDVAFGDVPQSIVRIAAMARCDGIVIGARDRLALANFFSPSVSSQVARIARMPVTVVKQKVVATLHSPRHVSEAAWRLRG